MILLALFLLVLVALAWGVAFWVRFHAERLKLVQAPNHRSSHIQPTPNGGGSGVVLAGTLAGAGLALLNEWPLAWVISAVALLLAAVGLRDDIRHLPIAMRFAVQIGAIAILLAVVGDMPAIDLAMGLSLSGLLLYVLLLLMGVWWTNLFNFMDGIDAIAGSQALIMLLAAACLSVWGQPDIEVWVARNPGWIWMLCIAAATLGFLLLNWPPAKIFMGDVGSLYLGFMIFALALISVRSGGLSYPVWLVLGALFVVDATVTLITRMLRGERWYEAHRSHVYQRLSVRWSGHRPVTLLAIAINFLWLTPLAWACHVRPQWALEMVLVAYVPLVVGAVVLGAGRESKYPALSSPKAST